MIDATFGAFFWEDIDLALSGVSLKPYFPYKLYFNHIYNLRSSPATLTATKWHVWRLKDIKHHPLLSVAMPRENENPEGYVHKLSASDLDDMIRI